MRMMLLSTASICISNAVHPKHRGGEEPPPISAAIIAGLLDGHYLTSVFIEVEPEVWSLPPGAYPGGSAPDFPGVVPLRPRTARVSPIGSR